MSRDGHWRSTYGLFTQSERETEILLWCLSLILIFLDFFFVLQKVCVKFTFELNGIIMMNIKAARAI